MASPTQLRSALKQDGRDLVGQFRALAPERKPVSIQRWSVRRLALTVGLIAAFVMTVFVGAGLLVPVQDLPVFTAPECGGSDALVLAAQAVPSATKLPCIAGLPSGWTFGNAQMHTGLAKVWLNSDIAGRRAVEVRLTGSCPGAGGTEVPSEEVGATRFERPASVTPTLTGERFYLFGGGCVRYRYAFDAGTPSTALFDVDEAIALEARADLVAFVEEQENATLCGAGTRCEG
jgi:hypothetical protein